MVTDRTFKKIVLSSISLLNAMQCWTAVSVDDTLFNTMFEACNASLENVQGMVHGHQGPRSLVFCGMNEGLLPFS